VLITKTHSEFGALVCFKYPVCFKICYWSVSFGLVWSIQFTSGFVFKVCLIWNLCLAMIMLTMERSQSTFRSLILFF